MTLAGQDVGIVREMGTLVIGWNWNDACWKTLLEVTYEDKLGVKKIKIRA